VQAGRGARVALPADPGYAVRLMASRAPHHSYTFEQYLEIEEVARVKHEFYAGEIYAMAGGTPEHAAMAAAVTLALGRQLAAGPCRVYSSDLRVRVLATGLATYPDVTVVCGPSERDPQSPTHVTNPKLIVEVLSPSTAAYDRKEKLQHYQQIPSLDAVVLIEHEQPQIVLWSRSGEDFRGATFGPGQVVPIESMGCQLVVDEVFAAARQA
jgi:Uma2 family endonuclease